MIKMIALCTVAVIILAVIFILLDRSVKKISGFFDLIPDLWQIDETEGCFIFFYQIFQGHAVKGQVSVTQIKPLLGKIKTLVNQVKIRVFHFLWFPIVFSLAHQNTFLLKGVL
jgi:hypothetical protein